MGQSVGFPWRRGRLPHRSQRLPLRRQADSTSRRRSATRGDVEGVAENAEAGVNRFDALNWKKTGMYTEWE